MQSVNTSNLTPDWNDTDQFHGNYSISLGNFSHRNNMDQVQHSISCSFDQLRGEDGLVWMSFVIIVLSVVGSAGNGLVLYVFVKKQHKLTADILIVALSTVDFSMCFLCMPFTVINLTCLLDMIDRLPIIHRGLIICTDAFMWTFPMALSTLIVATIAFERYFSICHPLKRIFTSQRIRAVLAVDVCVAVAIALFISIWFYYYITEHILYDYVTNVIYVYMSTYPVCLAILVVLYSLIFRFVYKTRSRMLHILTKSRDNSESHKLSARTRAANIRTALMLFVITIFFVVSYLPTFLRVFKVIDCNYVNEYFYFLNSVSNPFIYTLMSPIFRKRLKRTCTQKNSVRCRIDNDQIESRIV